MYAERWVVSELDPLQAVCNNLCTALKWVCYCINRNDNATITHHSIQKQRTTAKNYPWIHSNANASAQVRFHNSCSINQEKTSMRTNVIGPYTCILLPGMQGNSKWVACWAMILEVCASHTFLYKCAYYYFLYDVLWCITATCYKLL